MLKVKFVRSYRSKKGNVTFVYTVTGTDKQLEEYNEIQGDFYREDDDGNALWFTTRFIGKIGNLIITPNNKCVPDMSKFDMASSLAEQYGGNLGQSLANQAAAELLGVSPAAETAPAQKSDPETVDESNDGLGAV